MFPASAMMLSQRMNKSEFTLKSRFRKRFLIFLLLAGFVCSLNVGVYCAAGNSDSNRRSGSLAIHTGATSVRNYALTNAPHSLTENNFTKPKPVKQRAQPVALPEGSSRLNRRTHRTPFAGEVLFSKLSSCCSQPQGRAPPLFA